jgi:hypothetical protein
MGRDKVSAHPNTQPPSLQLSISGDVVAPAALRWVRGVENDPLSIQITAPPGLAVYIHLPAIISYCQQQPAVLFWLETHNATLATY